jgi:WD40 repeat protein
MTINLAKLKFALILVIFLGTGIQLKPQNDVCQSNAQIYGLEFSPDGKFFVAVWNSNQVRLWSVEHEQNLLTVTNANAKFFSVALSTDGDKIAASGTLGTLIWDTRNGKLLRALPEITEDASEKPIFSPDARSLLVVSHHGATLWNLDNGALEAQFPSNERYESDQPPFVSADFKHLMLHNSDHLQLPSTWQLWKISPAKHLNTFEVILPAFTTTHPLLVAVDEHGFVLWNNLIQTPSHLPYTEPLSSWDISPDGQHILIRGGIADNDLALWKLPSWSKVMQVNPVALPDEHATGQLINYAFYPEGNAFISISNSTFLRIHVWDVNSGDLKSNFEIPGYMGKFKIIKNSIVFISNTDTIEKYDLDKGVKSGRFC